jgi:hypothetical protein
MFIKWLRRKRPAPPSLSEYERMAELRSNLNRVTFQSVEAGLHINRALDVAEGYLESLKLQWSIVTRA